MNDETGPLTNRACCEGGELDASAPTWRDQDEALATLCKALGHPARARILRFLLSQEEGTCICGDICDHLPLAQSTVSQHLKMLKQAGLIQGRVDGPRICYCVDRERLAALKSLIAGL